MPPFAVTYLTAIVVTFGLLGLFAWALKRFGQPWGATASAKRRMQVVEKISLTPTTTACLLKVDTDTLLVVSTPQGAQVHGWETGPKSTPPQQRSTARKGRRS